MTTIESGRPGTALVLGATGGVGGEASRNWRAGSRRKRRSATA